MANENEEAVDIVPQDINPQAALPSPEEERKIIEGQLLLARAKRFTAKTIRGYIDKQEKIKAEQLALMAKLRPRAAKMLREADNGNADRNV